MCRGGEQQEELLANVGGLVRNVLRGRQKQLLTNMGGTSGENDFIKKEY